MMVRSRRTAVLVVVLCVGAAVGTAGLAYAAVDRLITDWLVS